MAQRTIAPGVHYIGVNHWDRQLFDALVPLPLGTSYNAYVVVGADKTAIIDSAEPEKKEEFLSRIDDLKLDRVDYLISLHSEQDHSGCLDVLSRRYPQSVIVTNEKCKVMLEAFLDVEVGFQVVTDGDILSLGGKDLRFVLAPWVHWPDTMFCYLEQDRILFTTDFFGSHIAKSGIFVEDEYRVYDAAKRYYAQIMMPFRANVNTSLKKVRDIAPLIIAPSHGCLYDNPEFIMNAYTAWSQDEVKNEVMIPWVSMHGSTRIMVEYLTDKLALRGIEVRQYNLETADQGEMAMTMVDAATLVFGSPSVMVSGHPLAVQAAYLVNTLRPKTRFMSLIGSYGWGTKLAENMRSILTNVKADWLEPVVGKGHPRSVEFEALDRLVEDIVNKHRSIGILE